MSDVCIKLGPPANDVQQYGVTSIYSKKLDTVYNVPVKNQDEFEKLMDDASTEVLKLGATPKEASTTFENRAKYGPLAGGLAGLSIGLLASRKKSNFKTALYTVATTTIGLIGGLIAAILPLPIIKSMIDINKANKLSISHIKLHNDEPMLKIELPKSKHEPESSEQL